MASKDARIVFTPSGRRGTFPHGTRLLDAARSIGVDVDSVCGGRGLCGRCRIVCMDGDFAKHAIKSRPAHLSEFNETEARYSERRRELANNHRLSCQAEIRGDLVIDVPPESQMHRQVVRKDAEHREIKLDPATRLYHVEVQPADLLEATGDLQRLCDALAWEWHLDDLACDPVILPGLQPALRDGEWRVTAAVHRQTTVVAVWPGFKSSVHGVALDIGSTTIAAHLVNLTTGDVLATDGIMNPQIRFGEDLMSRVSYVMMHPEGAAELTQAVREGVNDLIGGVCSRAGMDATDVVEMTIVGNPIMHHLFLGLDPRELGGAPFALAVDTALDLKARDIGIGIHPGANVYVLPCIAGHVGADAAGMVLAEEPHLLEEVSLVVDVGTNAEIVLGNRDRLLACSSPTGPAFEGAQISAGQRATPGAIERVRIDAESLEPRFSVIGSEVWSDDPGFEEAAGASGVTGICGSGIIEVVAEMYLAGIINEDGVVDGSLAARSERIVAHGRTFSYMLHDGSRKILVTQNDVRQVQLAKAALYAGVRLLQDRADFDGIDRIRLAGAFGSHIDPKYAMVLGLIPDCELDRVESAGNAAGMGALIALLHVPARAEIEAAVRRIEKIETAVEPKFQEYFVDAMAIPNKRDAFPRLFSVVDRPASGPRSAGGGRRRRKRAKPARDEP
ncbi:MAG: ASKHA domain-containing protein [Gammaproteobacteria bacterium]|nr:ASKHA domain-containing protein [Gammaproteobacteria bacterium]MDE0414057.1 ASKHA domain-containing protein [Gammaproteobacteria bacterium]